MTGTAYSSFLEVSHQGPRASYVRVRKSTGGFLGLFETALPAGSMSDPASPDLVLHQALNDGNRIRGDIGAGQFEATSKKGGLFLVAPDFAAEVLVDRKRHNRSVSFPMGKWKNLLGAERGHDLSFGFGKLHTGMFASPALRSAMRQLWHLSCEESVPSRLLAQAAGCEILAELCRLSGAPFRPVKGGLAPWAQRRCLEMMHARLAEDVGLDELAAEAQLSPFHFARMFKQSFGVPPRVYLTRLRMEKARELLALTNRSVTDIALEVGYSSNQVLARVFIKHQHMSPTDYRRVVRDRVRRVPGTAIAASAIQ